MVRQAHHAKIGVLMGGLSREREISLKSGKAVALALRARGHNVIEIDVDRDIAATLHTEKISVAFIALHGRYGEDGTIQGLLEILQIPYTGSGPLGSAIAMDKELTKRLVMQAGIRTPVWKMIQKAEGGAMHESPLPLPVIVKPNREGSTIGMSIVRETKQFRPALEDALRCDEQVLIEEFVVGTEVTVGVLDGKALPVLEIVPHSKAGFYDFAAKYTKGMTEYILPARIPEKLERQTSRISEQIFSLLGMSGVARMDFILNAKGETFFLEANTIPGMTETSLVPKEAAHVGINFEELCERILKGASLKL